MTGADQATHRGRIAKNAGVLAGLTLLSRLAGLVRDFCITHFFGASGLTDVFYMAFTIPNVLRRLVAEGTLTVTFQPEYQRVRQGRGEEAARRFSAGVLGALLVFVVALVAAGIAGARPLVLAFAAGFAADDAKLALCVELTRLMFPVAIAISLVALSMAVLNAHDVYAAPALAPVVMNLSMIALTIVGASTFERPILGVVAGVLVGGALQLAVQIPPLVRRRLLVLPALRLDDDVRRVLVGMVPGVFSLAVYQVNVIVLRQLASYLDEGSVSYYYTADRLMELTNGVFAIAIAQGAFTSMNELAAGGDLAGLKRVWAFSFKLQNMIAIPAALGLALLAEPIVSVLFLHGRFGWRDVEQTALCVVYGAAGLVATATIRGSVQVFYALGDRRSPAIASVVVVVVNLVAGVASLRLGVGLAGLAGSLALSNIVQAVLLVALLRRRLGALGLARIVGAACAKLALAAVASSGAYAVARLGDWPQGFTTTNAVVLFGAIAVAAIGYGIGAVVLRFEGADVVADKILRVIRRSR